MNDFHPSLRKHRNTNTSLAGSHAHRPTHMLTDTCAHIPPLPMLSNTPVHAHAHCEHLNPVPSFNSGKLDFAFQILSKQKQKIYQTEAREFGDIEPTGRDNGNNGRSPLEGCLACGLVSGLQKYRKGTMVLLLLRLSLLRPYMDGRSHT